MDKRIKEIPIDRLSALPDSLLIDVLGRLNLTEAVITCVLSKRWTSLWTDLPRLNFVARISDPESKRRFVSLINTALVNRTTNYLDAFSVDFYYDPCFASDVNAWLESTTVNYKTKRLELMLLGASMHHLPKTMCFNSSLKYVSLFGCRFVAPIQWPSLVSLKLYKVYLSQKVINGILSNCPVLESLVLEAFRGFRYLEMNSPRLTSLWIYCTTGKVRELEISAPYLTHLKIYWDPMENKLHLKNISSSLVYAKIEFYRLDTERLTINALEQLYQQLHRVRNLVLGSQIFKCVSGMLMSGHRFQLPSVRALCLKGLGNPRLEREIFAVVGLLNSSPKLEDLTLSYSDHRYLEFSHMFIPGAGGPYIKDDLVPDFSNLKSVVLIAKYVSDDRLQTMARILLKRAIVLEKMEIVLSYTQESFTSVTQKLQSYPRSSHIAQVLIVKSKK